MQVPSPASLGGLRIQRCCKLQHRSHKCGSDLALLWLWYRLIVAAWIQPLAWEPYATGAAIKRKKKKAHKSHLIGLELMASLISARVKSQLLNSMCIVPSITSIYSQLHMFCSDNTSCSSFVDTPCHFFTPCLWVKGWESQGGDLGLDGW